MISCLERSNQPDRALEVFEQMQVRMQEFVEATVTQLHVPAWLWDGSDLLLLHALEATPT